MKRVPSVLACLLVLVGCARQAPVLQAPMDIDVPSLPGRKVPGPARAETLRPAMGPVGLAEYCVVFKGGGEEQVTLLISHKEGGVVSEPVDTSAEEASRLFRAFEAYIRSKGVDPAETHIVCSLK